MGVDYAVGDKYGGWRIEVGNRPGSGVALVRRSETDARWQLRRRRLPGQATASREPPTRLGRAQDEERVEGMGWS